MSDTFINIPNNQAGGGGSGVTGINGQTGPSIIIAAGTGINVGSSGNIITITNTNVLPTGNPNTMAIFDNSGNLVSSPDFGIQTTTNGFFADGTLDPVTPANWSVWQQQYVPSASSVGSYSTLFQLNVDTDPTNTNFNIGDNTGNGGLTVLNLNANHNTGSTSTIGQLNLANGGFQLGDGLTHGILHQATGFTFGLNVNAGYELQGYTGFALYPNFNVGSLITGGGTGFLYNPVFSSNASGFHQALAAFPNIGAGVTVDHIHVIESGTNGNTTGTITDYIGVNTYLNDVNSTNVVGLQWTSQNLVLDPTSGNLNALNLSVTNLQQGGTTQNSNMINLNASGNVPSFTGISMNFSGMVATQGPILALSTNNAGIQIQALLDTANTTPSGVFGLNALGGEFHVAAGHPITGGAAGIGNNLGIQMLFEDNMPVDALGGILGFTEVGFLSQLAVASGKTVDLVNFMNAGAGIPPQSTGGTITNLNMYSALGALPSGGTLNVTNLTGYYVSSVLDAIGATNEWGIRVDAANADNFFQKSLAIGTLTKKVSNNDVALEIGGTKMVVFANVTTIQKLAIASPLPGAQVFDTTLNKMSYYNGTIWINF
jgi:hypothetical protein